MKWTEVTRNCVQSRNLVLAMSTSGSLARVETAVGSRKKQVQFCDL